MKLNKTTMNPMLVLQLKFAEREIAKLEQKLREAKANRSNLLLLSARQAA